MSDVTHVFTTRDDGRWSITSPQFPGFVGVYDDEKQARREFPDDLRWAGVTGQILGHRQVLGETPDGDEFMIRWAEMPAHEDRQALANLLFVTLTGSDHRQVELEDLEPDRAGVYQFVVCLADDTLGWLLDQLAPGDTLVAALSVADVFIAMTQVASDKHEGWDTLEDLGWDRNLTMAELMARRPRNRPLSLQA